MARGPWWQDRVAQLLAPHDVTTLDLGALWRLRERLDFVRQNVDPALLALDVAAAPALAEVWSAFGVREATVRRALEAVSSALAGRMRAGQVGRAAFRASWEGLGFERHAEGAGTPADDFLDGLLHLDCLADDLHGGGEGHINLGTRAARVSDFLSVTRPGPQDVVFDLGSGSGKLALTVAASSDARVHGVEYVSAYVDDAARGAARLGLAECTFAHADARDVDLSAGTIFYLYYPFHGVVARDVAAALGALGAAKPITVYAAGPQRDYGEYFLAQAGLSLAERRGEFADVLVLRSAGALSRPS